MKNLTNLKKMHIFFVGIGGISMSGLAKLVKNMGAKVSGSDRNNNSFNSLNGLGITTFSGHNKNNITKDIDLIVYSSAIDKDNVELVAADLFGIKKLERHEFLGLLSKDYKEVIAISGTHGKTTVTSMIGYIFSVAKLNPTIHIGGESVNLKDNTIIGDNNYLIVEACEYKDSFLSLNPSLGVVLNIDLDHTDYYKDINQLKNSFINFGTNCKYLLSSNHLNVIHKNHKIVDKSWVVKNIKRYKIGYSYDLYFDNKKYINLKLNIFGKHNIYNSIFAVAVAKHYNIPKKYIRKAIISYLGVKRRYEFLGKINNIPVIIDYAHHPTEIKNSLEGIKEIYVRPLVIFQPHTYTRTLSLMDEFINELNGNNIIIYKTYPARENYLRRGDGYTLFRKLKNKVKYYAVDLNTLKGTIKDILKKYNHDVIIVLGAGDLADKFVHLINSL